MQKKTTFRYVQQLLMPLSEEKKDFFFTAKVKIAACLTAVSKLALNTLIGMPTMVQGPNKT